VKPYWQSDTGDVVVYRARWEDVVAAGCVPVRDVALVHADPPYGIALKTTSRGRVRYEPGLRNTPKKPSWAPVVGDERPYDPAELLAIGRPSVLWGGNHYADKLPASGSWIFWDKRADQPEIDNADGELAWTNLPGSAVRRFVYLWRGLTRAGEGMGGVGGSKPHLHPTQKPIALSTFVFGRARLKPGALVFVPYLGSGPDLPAARAMGLRVIGCEVVEDYCRTAVARLGAVTAETAARPVGPLFGGAA
jgi:hypothetical protein